jgi:D-ribose pyranose/furanose isomerase RbsD
MAVAVPIPAFSRNGLCRIFATDACLVRLGSTIPYANAAFDQLFNVIQPG